MEQRIYFAYPNTEDICYASKPFVIVGEENFDKAIKEIKWLVQCDEVWVYSTETSFGGYLVNGNYQGAF